VRLPAMSSSPHSASSLLRCTAASVHPSAAPSDALPLLPSFSRSAANCATSDPSQDAPPSTLFAHARRKGYLPASALQPISSTSHSPGQLRFREELMHQLFQQLPIEHTPRRHGGHPPPPNASASIHSSELSSLERDCKQCSHQPRNRKQTNYVCSACDVHLCLGECFRSYHA